MLSKVLPQGAVPVNPFPQVHPQFMYQAPAQTTSDKQAAQKTPISQQQMLMAATPLYNPPGAPPFVPMPGQLYRPWYTPPTS